MQALAAAAQQAKTDTNILQVPPLQQPAQPTKKPGKRIFVSSANSLLGQALFDELRNDHIAIQPDADEFANKFFVTVNPRDAGSIPLPSQTMMKVLNYKTKPRTFKKKVQSCDYLVVDLMAAAVAGTMDEVEQVIKLVKAYQSGEGPKEQTLVLVSSVMTWANTAKKLAKKSAKPAAEDDDEESDQEKDVLYFTDKDFQLRNPPPKYQQIKTIEALAMAAQRVSRTLKV